MDIFANKENTHVPTKLKQRQPTTPTRRRVPLGGKDKNIKTPLRVKRTRTPKKKLDVLRDDKPVYTRATVKDVKDDEIEYVAVKQPELPYIPLNYTPFTDEDLSVLKQPPSVRLQDKRHVVSDVGSSDEELDVDFNFGDDQSTRNTPHFMQPTFVSNAKKVDVYHDGLSSADLQKLIDE